MNRSCLVLVLALAGAVVSCNRATSPAARDADPFARKAECSRYVRQFVTDHKAEAGAIEHWFNVERSGYSRTLDTCVVGVSGMTDLTRYWEVRDVLALTVLWRESCGVEAAGTRNCGSDLSVAIPDRQRAVLDRVLGKETAIPGT